MNATPRDRVAALYVASTPYHLVLALADAERQAGPSALYFYGTFPDADRYLAALQADPPLLAGLRVQGLARPAKHRAARRGAARALHTLFDALDPDRVVVFNDRHDLSQLALALASRRPGARRTCFEDGSSFYTGWRAPPASRWDTLCKRLFTTRDWHPIGMLGTHPLVEDVRVQRLDAVREELRDRARPLALDVIRSPVLHALAQRMIDDETLTCPDVLLAPALINGPAWTAAARTLLPRSARVAFKYHPRESEDDPAALAGSGQEIPRHVPTELLYLLWGRTPAMLVGDGDSTALLTASLFNGDMRVIGLHTGPAPAHAPAYACLGIELRRYD